MNKKKKEARGGKRERWIDKGMIWSAVKGAAIGYALAKLLGVITKALWNF